MVATGKPAGGWWWPWLPRFGLVIALELGLVRSPQPSWGSELVTQVGDYTIQNWQVEQGLKPSTVHFSEVNVDERNAEWHEVYKDRPLDKVKGDFEAVRRQTERRVQAFSDQDLNSSERFPALKGNPFWEWIENDSYGHEAEHREEILAWRKAKGI